MKLIIMLSFFLSVGFSVSAVADKCPSGWDYWHNACHKKGKGDRSRDVGIRCVDRGKQHQAMWDDKKNGKIKWHRKKIKVGSHGKVNGKKRGGYGCMGRCGAGCGVPIIPSAYTQDCLDHDMCSLMNNASGGAGDKNCGDEFKHAEDDWAWGNWNGC